MTNTINTERPYIFLVDDDKDDQQLFVEALSALQLQNKVDTFNNGVDLMANLLDKDSQLPDIIFLDLNMPLMNGEECLIDIRNEPELCQIPIVIYSSFFDKFKVDLLREKGADRYLQKPSSFEQLKSSIERSMASLGLGEQNETEFIIT